MNTGQYLTFEIISSGNINWCSNNNSSIHNTIEYRKNGGDWTTITASQAGVNISVVDGDLLEFRGDNATYSNAYNRFGMFGDGKTTCQFKAKGNIMSLINSTDFANLKSFTGTYTFRAMFNNCGTLVDASELLLPATGLTTGSYRFMFLNCTGLTAAPVLPAETLTSECYYGMFNGCRILNNITCLATNISASNCLYQWVNSVQTTSGTFYKNPNMSSWTRGISAVPNNWTIVDYNPFGPDTDSLTFEYSGGTQSIELVSDNPWTATTNGWITLSQYSGETGGVINVTVANNIFSPKIGSITFTDGENTAIVSVEQKGDSRVILKNLYRNGNKVKQMWRNGEKLYQMFERFFFEVDTESIEFEYSGSTTTITINASEPWTMTLPEWISASTISGTGSATVTLTTIQNPTEDAQTGNIVITCEGRTITIEVEQKGSVGLGTPLTFEILSDGYINWVKRSSSAPTVTIEYRINEGEWVSVTNTSTSGYRFNVVTGDKVEFRGTNSRYGGNYYNTFSGSTCQYNLYGNMMSMVNATDFENLTSFSNTYVFESMFRYTNVIDASSLLLPATVLTQACYQSMFVGCTSLIAAPELPATTLAIDCYNSMFNSCSNLTIAPTLPATTLTERCYYRMFEGCSKLNYIECLATSGIGQNNSTYIWVNGVQTSSGTFVKDPSARWSRGTSGVPNNWTIVDKE